MSLPPDTEDRLPRSLGLWSAAAVLVGVTIGSGIFRVPSVVAGTLHSPGPMMLIWVVGGIVTLAGALSIAELGAMYPRSGGVFVYLLEAHGSFAAFLYGWTELTVLRASSVGGISAIFASYLGHFVPMTAGTERWVAAGLILLISALNYVGVTYASLVMNVTTLLKYGALLGLTLFAFGSGAGSLANFTAGGGGAGISPWLTALVPVLWTYDGWSNLTFVGGEVKDPGRSLPRAMLIGTLGIVVIYLLINAAYLYLLPVEAMAGAERVAVSAAARIPVFGQAGVAVIAGIVMLSTFGSVNGSILTGPRVFFAMSDRKLFFPLIARVSPRFRTPSVAIWLSAALGMLYVLQNSFAQLADRYILGVWPFYALAVLGVFRLRRTRADLPRPYRTAGYPWTPLLFLVAAVGMIVNAFITDLRGTGITFGIIAAGVPVYFIWQAVRRGEVLEKP